MARVFVSHSGEDPSLADEVHRWLVEDSHEAFLDQDLYDGIRVGDQWEQRLHERLRWADAMVCVLTSNYRDSVWCTAELAIAQWRGSRVLPVRAEPDLDHPLVKSLQHVDITRDPAAARAKLAAELLRVDAAGGSGWPDDRSPFPGLRALDTDEHLVFFGRSHEVDQLAELLRSPPEQAERAVLLVIGPSGCGKSSLVRAGLLPVMVADEDWWMLPVIRPGTAPVAALARELAAAARRVGLGWTVTDVRGRLDDGDLTGLVDDLLLAVPGRRRHLLLVVDQFEELLTQTGAEERARFAVLLQGALAGPVQVVATLRPEFLDPLLASPELSVLPTRTQTLRPLRPEALRAVIEGPADRAGIGIDEDLVSRLVADTGGGEALPLLAYTLAELTDGITRGDRISTTRYERLGGVQGALAGQADAALVEAVTAGGRDRDQVIRELLRLVTVDEQGRPTRWRIRRDELPEQVLIELQPFVDRRLLTTDTDTDHVVVGVAHEAFLSAWPPLREAIIAASSALRARRRVEQAAVEWAEHQYAPARLWERGQLAAALTDTGAQLRPIRRYRPTVHKTGTRVSAGRCPRWPGRHWALSTDRVELTPQAEDFLRTSIRRDRRRRSRAVTILSVLLVLALMAAGVAYGQQRIATERQTIATGRQLAATAVSHLETDLQLAQLLAVEAYRMYPDPQTRSALFQAVTASPRLVRYLDAGSEVTVLNGSRSGTAVVAGTEDGHVVHWDLATGIRERIRIGAEPITSVAVDDAGTRVIGADGATAVLWDLGSGQQSVVASESARAVAISPSGDRAAVLMGRGRDADVSDDVAQLTLFDADSEQQLIGVPVDGGIEKVGLPNDGTVTLVSAGGQWERRSMPDLQVTASSDQILRPNYGSSGISADGSYFVWGAFGEVGAWDVAHSPGGSTHETPDLYATTGVSQSFYEAVTVSPDGSLIATVATGTVHVSSVVTDQTVSYAEELPGNSQVNLDAVAFVGNDRLVSATGTSIAFWDLHAVGRVGVDLGVELPSVCRACSPHLSPSPNGRLVVFVDSAYTSGEVMTYRLDGAGTPQALSNPEASADGGAPGDYATPVWSHDGERLVLLGFGDDTAFSWDAKDFRRPPVRWPSASSPATPVTARASVDGSRVVVVNADGAIVVRRFDNGAVVRTLAGSARLDRLGWPPPPSAAAVSLDLTTAALVEQERVTLVDTETGNRRSLPGGPADSVFFTQDRLLVLRPGGAVEVWDVDGRRLLTSAAGGDFQWSLAAPIDGHLLARLRTDDSVTLTVTESGDSLGSLVLPPSGGDATRIAFTEDGKYLVAGTAGGRLTRWDMTETAWLRHACEAAGRNLIAGEWHRYVGTEPPTDLNCLRP